MLDLVNVLPGGPATYLGSRVTDLTTVDGTVFFTHVDTVRGPELGRSDGTAGKAVKKSRTIRLT